MGLLTNVLARRADIVSKRRVRPTLVSDTFTEVGTAQVQLANHESDFDSIDFGSSWERHPSSIGTLFVGGSTPAKVGMTWNDNGSARSIGRHLTPPGTCDYALIGEFEVINTVAGHRFGICARMLDTQQTYYSAYVNVSSAYGFELTLEKCVGGVTAVLQTSTIIDVLPTIGDVYTITLDCSNDQKVAYLQGPGDSYPVRRCASGDNSIPDPGFIGLSVLRCDATNGLHLRSLIVVKNGPQDPIGTSPAPTPDPVQAPALLWTPNYSVATNDIGNDTIWHAEQEPYVRGVNQPSRISVVTGASVPGSGVYKPATGALRIELRPYHNADITVTATVDATDTATTLNMSSGDVAALFDRDFFVNNRTGEKLRVAGAPFGTAVPVLRHQTSTAKAILAGDTFYVVCGDVSDSGNPTNGYPTNRAECHDRWGPTGGTAPNLWPDPVGSIRWYGVDVYFPTDYAVAGAGLWTVLDQWKGNFGGSPPRSIEVDHGLETIKLGGTRPHISLGPIVRGAWTRLVFGFRWEPTGLNGWVEAWRDGVLVIPKRFEATMDWKYNKPDLGPDPIYYKQGIYRTTAHTVTHIVYYGPTRVGTTMADVA